MVTISKKQNTNVSNQSKDILAEKVHAVLKQGIPLYKMHGMSKQHMENLYTVAYNLYSAEKYEEAGRLFESIVFYNYLDKKSWLGAAGSAEMLKNYTKALTAYSYAALLDASDPLPALHAFDCHFALKNYPQALCALEAVIAISSKNPKYADIKKRAEFLRETLHSTIQESKKIS